MGGLFEIGHLGSDRLVIRSGFGGFDCGHRSPDRGQVFLSHQLSALLDGLLRGHDDGLSLSSGFNELARFQVVSSKLERLTDHPLNLVVAQAV